MQGKCSVRHLRRKQWRVQTPSWRSRLLAPLAPAPARGYPNLKSSARFLPGFRELRKARFRRSVAVLSFATDAIAVLQLGAQRMRRMKCELHAWFLSAWRRLRSFHRETC